MAASEEQEKAGSDQYHASHMGAIFKEGFSFSGYERDLLALNRGDGTFVDISGVSGADSISDGRGALFADLDNDGDLDIFLTTAQREAHFLFRNNVGDRNRFLRVELQGTAAGRDAFGAVVRVQSGGLLQTKIKSGGSGYLSQHDPRLLFGLGDTPRVDRIEVIWPGGSVQTIEGVPAGSVIRVVQGTEGFTTIAERSLQLVDPMARDEMFLAGLGFVEGERFPDLELRTTDGASVSLRSLLRPGRKMLVNLWATWCVPCAEEIPELQRIADSLSKAGVDLVGVSVDLDTVDGVPGYVAAKGVTYPIYTTDEAALEALYPRGEAVVPVTVLLDDRGQVSEIYSGWSEKSAAALNRLVAVNR